MDKIMRCITSDGTVMAAAVDASDMVFTAQKIHGLSRSCTAALGRLLCVASLMGNMLKQKGASVTLRVSGGGEMGVVTAVGDSSGNVRGCVDNPVCATEYYPNGKINVSAAVGGDGILSVVRDYGTGEPYVGQVRLVSGEIAEDIAAYYVQSEQIPTVCALGVLLNKDDGEVMLAGGLLIQVLPGADDEAVSKLEQNASALEPVTTMLAKGMTILDICKAALSGFELEVLDENPVNYVCTCSREKLENYFCTLGDGEIRSLPDESGTVSAKCHFCGKEYTFTRAQLEALINSRSN